MHRRALFLALAATSFAAPPEPKFKPMILDSAIQIGYGLAIADVDGDKAPDVLLADKKQFVWYRNPGAAKATEAAAWTKHVLAENLTEKDNVCLAARDIDGDGKCEIAVGAEWNPGDTEKSGAVFYLIPPTDRTQPWEAVKFPSVEPTTHRMKWVKLDEKEWGLIVSPLHGRGNKNGEGVPVKTLCYRKPADVRGAWKAEVMDESLHATHNFDIVHWEGPAVLIGGKEGLAYAKYKDGRWASATHASRDTIQGGAAFENGAGEIREGRVGTGPEAGRSMLATIEPMHGNTLAVWWPARQDGAPTVRRQILTDQLADGHALACEDVLGTGSDQIVVGWRGNPKQPRPVGIKLFTPLDDKGEKWRESLIDDNEMACEDLVLADLNADGKLDIVASGRATRNVKLYFNETTK